MSIPYRLRSIFTNVSKNLFCSEASAKNVHNPSAINTGRYTDSCLETEQCMREKPEEHTTKNIIPDEKVNQLPYTTTTLRVALHCEGCKRKVVDALCKIKGVKKVDISMQKQKVVVSGHVDPSTILKVIKRTGKNVEFWPSDDQVATSEAHKEDHSKPQQSGLTYTNQEGHHELMKDCPIEPIAEMNDETHEVPVAFRKVQLNSYSSVDAKYTDPSSAQSPTHTSLTRKFAKSIPQREGEIRRLHSVTKVLDDEQPASVQEKLPARRSRSYLDDFDITYSYLSQKPAHHRRHTTCEDGRSELEPPRAVADRTIRKLTKSYADSHRPYISDAFPIGVERRKRTKEASEDMESDNDPEELFAVVKTKKGVRFVPVDSSPLLRMKPTKNLPDNSESELRRQQGVSKKQIPHAAVAQGRVSKQATTPCKCCSNNNGSRYSTDADACSRQQYVLRVPRSLRSDPIARHKASPSPDYRTADQFLGEDEEEGEEEEEDEEDVELCRRRELSRLRRRSGLHY